MIFIIETRNAIGITPLIEALNLLGGWPVLGQSGVYSDTNFNWTTLFIKHLTKYGSSPLFSLKVAKDFNDTSRNLLYVSFY